MSAVWSVRGVSPELRRAIVEAAERDGVSVAAWLEQRLSANFDDEAPEPRPTSAPAAAEPVQPDANDSLDGILAAIDSCLANIVALETASPPQ
jgi:hypothetical protein